MSKITITLMGISSLIFFSGCEINNQEIINIDGQDIDKRFFSSQAITETDSDKTKELKKLLLNKKWFRVYPYSDVPYITKFSNYFDESGAQKSANIDDNNQEKDITFEQFKITDYHIQISYYKPVECDFEGVENGIVKLTCSDGHWKLAPSLDLANENLSDCNVE